MKGLGHEDLRQPLESRDVKQIINPPTTRVSFIPLGTSVPRPEKKKCREVRLR